MSGVLNIDKPPGMTSHDVVAHVRRFLKPITYDLPPKVGHTGTLDPFATGVLLVVVGPATRLIQFTHAWDKEYEATFTLGATSDTDDITGQITKSQTPMTTQTPMTKIKKTLKKFIGNIEQRPPAYSAVKVAGKKMYEYARAGLPAVAPPGAKAGESTPRFVTVHEITVTRYAYPELDLTIRCGTGTYIRSIARDFGETLGTGAYVSSLRRTRIGLFDIKESITLNKLSTAFPQALQDSSTLVSHLPRYQATSHNIKILRQGGALSLPAVPAEALAKAGGNPITIYDENNQLVGIASYDPTTFLLSPRINL